MTEVETLPPAIETDESRDQLSAASKIVDATTATPTRPSPLTPWRPYPPTETAATTANAPTGTPPTNVRVETPLLSTQFGPARSNTLASTAATGPTPPAASADTPPPAAPAPPAVLPALPTMPSADLTHIAEIAKPLASMAAIALPMITQALSGLFDGGGSQGGSGLSPQATQALKTLSDIESLYGAGGTSANPNSAPGVANSDAASGRALDSYRRTALFQSNAASAHAQLDAELAGYLGRLAQNNKSAAGALSQLRAEVLAQVDAIKSNALTPEGRRQIDGLLIQALERAHRIVGDTQTTTDTIARAVDGLTDRYEVILLGGGAPATDPSNARGEAAVKAALSQLGKPWIFNTAGPNSFDCSGLTLYAARVAGVKLPHKASWQKDATRPIPNDQIRPGDLIFPKGKPDPRDGREGHVQMYIGNGLVVHAGGPKPKRVQIVPLTKKGFTASRWT